MAAYTLGVDYGTNSVRAVVVDCANGANIGTHVFNYPTGDQGVIIDSSDHNLARQNPQDYLDGLETSVVEAIKVAGAHADFSATKIIGIGVDTTGSTPIPINAEGVPLAMTDAFRDVPAAQAWLWKDHTSADEAARITELAAEHRPQYIAKCGTPTVRNGSGPRFGNA